MKNITLISANNVFQDTIDSSFDGYNIIFNENTLTNQTLEIDVTGTTVIDSILITITNTDGVERYREILDLNFKGIFVVKIFIDKTKTRIRYVAYVNKSSTSTGSGGGGTTTITPTYPAIDSDIATFDYDINLFQSRNSTSIPHTFYIDGSNLINNQKQKRLNFNIKADNITNNQPSEDATLNTQLTDLGTGYNLKMASGRILNQSDLLENLSNTAPYNLAPFNYTTPPTGANGISIASGEYQLASAYDSDSIFYFIKRPIRNSIKEMTSSIIINIVVSFLLIDENVNIRAVEGDFFINVINPLNPLVHVRVIFLHNSFDAQIIEIPPVASILFYNKFSQKACNFLIPSATYTTTESTTINTTAKRISLWLHRIFCFLIACAYSFEKPKAIGRVAFVTPCSLFSQLCANTTQYYLSSICDSMKRKQLFSSDFHKIPASDIVSQGQLSTTIPSFYTIDGKKYVFVFESGATFQRATGSMSASDIIGNPSVLPAFQHHNLGLRIGNVYTPPLYQSFFENNNPSVNITQKYAHPMTKGLLAGNDLTASNTNFVLASTSSGVGVVNPSNFAHFQFINPETQASEFFVTLGGVASNMTIYSPIIDATVPIMVQTSVWTEICYNFYLLFDNVTAITFIVDFADFAPNLTKYNLTNQQKFKMLRLRFQPWETIIGKYASNTTIWNNWNNFTGVLKISYNQYGDVRFYQ